MLGGNVSLKDVPAVAWVCITVAFVAILAAVVALDITGSKGTEFRATLNIVANLVSILLGGGGLLYAGAAARSAKQTEIQTNGLQDAERRAIAEEAAAAAVARYKRETGA